MKKKRVLMLLLSSCLVLATCSGCTKNSISTNTTTDGSNASNDTTTDGSNTSNDTTTDSQEAENSETTNVPDHSEAKDEKAITISFEDIAKTYNAENDDIILEYNLTYPVVNIKDNTKATELINQNLQEQKATIEKQVEEFKQDATEYYEIASQDEYYSPSYAYYNYYSYRSDSAILSFGCTDYSYMGGAHGQSVFNYYNYDTKTGELLTLNDIFTDPQISIEQIKAHILLQASQPYYREIMYEDFQATEEEIEFLFEGNYWYLAKDGLHFSVSPYFLGPYASGEINFTIPYEKIPDLKKEYTYDTFLLHTSLIGEPLTAYLDGDDVADTITYEVIHPYGSYISDDSEEYHEPTFFLEINGTDYSQDLIDAVEFITENFSSHYYAVDLDESDEYMELMIIDYGFSDDNQTHFFRYADEKLIYLGSIPDAPTDEGFSINGDGTINSIVHSNLLQTISLPALYKLTGESLAPVKTDWYEIHESDLNDSVTTHNILQNVTVYTEADLNSETITLTPEDGPVTFPATDNVNWYQIKTADGKIYYMYMSDFETIPNNGVNTNATDIFENLLLAG